MTRLKKIGAWYMLEDEGDKGIINYLHNTPNSVSGWHEFLVDRLEPRFLQKRVAIDCGACYGMISVPLAQCFEQVHAFEISPRTYIALQANTSHYNNIIPHNVGLSDRTRTVAIDNSLLSGANKIVHNSEHEAQVVTLDSFDFENVDFIKIDVEGHEYDLLLGAVKTLQRCKPLVYIEIHQSSASFRNTFTILLDAGYVLTALDRGSDYIFEHKTKIKEYVQ